ncbi:gliding motility-associated C-terminal domain-containing protein [Ferruginibacter sp. SUN106]|uniref:gliding motility-associated C-terminal domain-containing protein n=1 Tax=Ferruginibacter sp. SUN106 TaxID=2978348 RepID=UPI003D367FCD
MNRAFYFRTICIVAVLCMAFNVQAQLCNGSLGDPVVNITFGSGGGSTGFTPTNAYTYTSSQCPNDGYYTITNSTASCFGNSWHTVMADHTGNGAFMLVNASVEPGDFFLTTVTDLCPNTTYEFAAWIMNVLNKSGIRPNITFTIETVGGTILQQYSTGDIPETFQPTWKQYGFFFSTPVNNAVIVLRMRNNAPGGLGNDLAMDDITFRPCGAAKISSAIQGNSNDTVNVCEGNTTNYTFAATVTTGYISPVYQWQVSTDSGTKWKDIAGATSLSYLRKPTVAGAFWYRMTITEASAAANLACRIASNYVVINVHAKPLVNAGPDLVMLSGNNVTINGVVDGESPVFYWDPPDHLSDIKIMTPVASPTADITYTLYAASSFGCTNQDAMAVKVVAGIFVPNAFTPNNDGFNDHWRIPFLDPLFGATVSVYNRLGQQVYYTSAATVDWDGNFKGLPQPSGAYVYYIRFKSGYHDIKGSILLIR